MDYYRILFPGNFQLKIQIGFQAKEKTKHLDVLNKNVYNTTNKSKNQEIGYIFLLNPKSWEKIVTTYNIFKT